MNKIDDIARYLNSIELDENNQLEFLIEDNIRTNPNHSYIVRKIISQLEVRDHIIRLGPSVKSFDSGEILKQITRGNDPVLLKRIIAKDKSKENLITTKNEYGETLPVESQINELDYKARMEVSLKKISVFDKIRRKLFKTKSLDYSYLRETKGEKIVEYYYTIPEEIENIKKELSDAKWFEIGKKANLNAQLRGLRDKQDKYYDSILKYYTDCDDNEKLEQMQKGWKEFYLSHEKEMIEFLDGIKKERPDLRDDDLKLLLEDWCQSYFFSVGNFSYNVFNLKSDISGNLEVYKNIFCKDHKEQGLEEILDDLRQTMDGKLLPNGMIKYRELDLLKPLGDEFFANTSSGADIKQDMEKLSLQYEELKMITDQEQYIDKAIDIYETFLQIHPYKDGNGRTSRALLDIMLVNREIVPPILYDTYYDRGIIDEKSVEFLFKGNKEPLRSYIKKQISKVQPDSDDSKFITNDKNLDTYDQEID